MAENDTYHRLLDAAIRLFAERGFDATSVRDLTQAAGANQAAIHYHFGSKDDLLRAATDRVVEPLNRRRHELLDDLLITAEGHPTSDDLLRIFLQADIEALTRLTDEGAAARLFGRVYRDPSPRTQEMALEQFGETGARFIGEFTTALPELSVDEIVWRVNQVVSVIINLFAQWPEEGLTEADSSALLDRLVAFLGPGLRAPPPTPSPPA